MHTLEDHLRVHICHWSLWLQHDSIFFNFVVICLQMDWGEQTAGLEKLQSDLTQSWEYLRAIAKHETSTDTTSMEKKMKCAQSLTEAAQKLKVSL